MASLFIHTDLESVRMLLKTKYARESRDLVWRQDQTVYDSVALTPIAAKIVWQRWAVPIWLCHPGLATALAGEPEVRPSERPIMLGRRVALGMKMCHLLIVRVQMQFTVGT
jgi:hypothetical protein